MSTTATATALTAENRSLEIDGATLRYRRFGDDATEAPPLLCLQHFRGNLDNWDPALVDLLAAGRDVILLANRGVGGSTGVVPDNVEAMARDVLRFIDALGLTQMDLLGFSLGGFIAQEVALVRPRLVRRLVLAGTAPQGAPKLARLSGITQPTLVANGDNDKMMLSETSRLLAEHLPNARLSIYPDSGHGFLDQYPEQFGRDVRAFLDGN